MLTKITGVDLQAVIMTMLALIGLYLVLTRAPQLNALVRTVARAGIESFVVLQGRNVRPTLGRAAA